MYNSGSGTVEEATVSIVSLFSIKGLQYMLTSAVTNFTSYAPLGFTIVIMLGIGVAESSGYLNGLIRKVVKVTPAALVTPMVVFIGVMTNVAENAGLCCLYSAGAMIFKAYKKHPLAGIAAGFAGVSGGFSANLLIGSADATLSGFSTASSTDAGSVLYGYTAGKLVLHDCIDDPDHHCGNLYYRACDHPRLGPYKENGDGTLIEASDSISAKEEKALKAANWVFVGIVAFYIICCIPKNSFMRNPETGS